MLDVRKCHECGEVAAHYDATPRCVECHKGRMRRYYAGNRVRIIARVRDYDGKNRPEKVGKAWRQ